MKTLSGSGSNNLWTAVGFFSLATLSVALRLVLRLRSQVSLNWADIFILLAIVTSSVWFGFLTNWKSHAYRNASAEASCRTDSAQDIVFGPGPGTLDLVQIQLEWENGGQIWGVALLKVSSHPNPI